MAPTIASTVVDRPAAEVFAYATDPTRFHEWQQGVIVTTAQAARYRVLGDFALLGRVVQFAAGPRLVVALAGIIAGRNPAAGDSVGGVGVPGRTR